MGKSLEAGQLAGYLVVDVETNDITVGTGVTISADDGSVTATTYYGDGANLYFTELDVPVIKNNTIVEQLTVDTFDSSVGIVTLTYSTNSMVAICTDASSDITLKVDNIPTTSDFDNRSLSFSVVVINTGVARTCTTVYFNNQVMPIKWFGGSIEKALSGGVTRGTSGYDIYNFIGINTVGPASNISNYEVLGIVNGNFY